MQEINNQWERVKKHPDFAKYAALYMQGREGAIRQFFRR